MHARTKIRQAVLAKLQPHPLLTTLFAARTKPNGEDRLPAANIVTGSEVSEDLGDWEEMRSVQLQVVLEVVQDSGIVDKLDDLAEVVEALLGDDQTLGGLCDSFRYKGSDPDYTSAAAQETASLTLTYECKYRWAPDPAVDVLGTVSVLFDMAGPRNEPQLPAGPDGQIDASTTINLP
jgi:hypothetical protein